MNKSIGYIIGGIGVLMIALSYQALRDLAKIPSLGMSDITWMIAGVVIALVGGFLIYKTSSSSEQPKEIPIYEGQGKERKVVGLQRVKE